MHPFKQKIVKNSLIREFSKDTNSDELVWHRDREDRDVTVLEGHGWMLQLENRLPVLLETDIVYHIPKNIYHRIIKGATQLVVEIKKRNMLKLTKSTLFDE
tara:strand:+ start:165 stop:467 length:303 start_codon:yes stop_codon:yes gene_type:complete